jgi:hypothetical protein
MALCPSNQPTTSKETIMQNITTLNAKVFERFIKPMDYVSNGTDVGRYFGTTKRGVHVVAWGDKRDDYDTAKKLTQYLARHSSN